MPITDKITLALLSGYLQWLSAGNGCSFMRADYEANLDVYTIHYSFGGNPHTLYASRQKLQNYSQIATVPLATVPSGGIAPTASSVVIASGHYQAYYTGSQNLSALYPSKALKCECGAVKCGQPRHSPWCDLYSV